jgi:hypothetical protein
MQLCHKTGSNSGSVLLGQWSWVLLAKFPETVSQLIGVDVPLE